MIKNFNHEPQGFPKDKRGRLLFGYERVYFFVNYPNARKEPGVSTKDCFKGQETLNAAAYSLNPKLSGYKLISFKHVFGEL